MPAAGYSATLPVSNSNELRAALAVAERNGEDDIIKLFLAHELMDILTSS